MAWAVLLAAGVFAGTALLFLNLIGAGFCSLAFLVWLLSRPPFNNLRWAVFGRSNGRWSRDSGIFMGGGYTEDW